MAELAALGVRVGKHEDSGKHSQWRARPYERYYIEHGDGRWTPIVVGLCVVAILVLLTMF